MLRISSWEYTNTNTNSSFSRRKTSLSQRITGCSYSVLCPCPGLISSRSVPDDLIYICDFYYYLCVDDS